MTTEKINGYELAVPEFCRDHLESARQDREEMLQRLKEIEVRQGTVRISWAMWAALITFLSIVASGVWSVASLSIEVAKNTESINQVSARLEQHVASLGHREALERIGYLDERVKNLERANRRIQ